MVIRAYGAIATRETPCPVGVGSKHGAVVKSRLGDFTVELIGRNAGVIQ